MATKNLLIVAGETSGDTLGAALVRELTRQDPDVRVAGLGGPRMAAAGVELLQDLTAHAVVGISAIFGSIFDLIGAYRKIVRRLNARPDAIVLIDFPDFNLMIARHAKKIGVPVIYYVSPQVWAWRRGRLKTIAERVRKMLVLFDFEKDLYESVGVDVTHVGHPLLDTMADQLKGGDRAAVRRDLGLPESGVVVGLLPGSRRKEIKHVYPLLLEAAKIVQREQSGLTFVTARSEWLAPEVFEAIAGRHGMDVRLVAGRAHDVMFASDLLLACSGTATLEAALLQTPMVVTYKADLISYMLFAPFIPMGRFALPNIITGRELVPERYVFDATPEKIAAAALKLLRGGLEQARQELGVIREKMGQPGAAVRAAAEILRII